MISEYMSTFSQMMKDYPWMVGIYSLYGMTVLTYCLRFIPSFFGFIKTQSITTIELNNAGWSGNEAHFQAFMAWYLKSPYAKWSRYLSLDGKFHRWEDEDVESKSTYVIGAGYGTHFFFYKKRLYWFSKGTLQSSGSDKEKQNIIIKTLGRTQKPLIDLVADFAVKPKESELSVYAFKDDDWNVISRATKRPLGSVILRADIKDELVNNMEYFYKNREWYVSRGLPYKQTYVLHGLPGTGKSSTIKALASHFNKNICLIDITSISNAIFEKAMASVPRNSIVLIEDFDSCRALHSREDRDGNDVNSLAELTEVLSLSKVLNVLDGVVSLDDTIVFLTTNHLEKIDPAMIRKGRVDYIKEIPYLEDAEVKAYIKLMYPEKETPNKTFVTIAGCDIQSLYLEHREDFDSFVSSLAVK